MKKKIVIGMALCITVVLMYFISQPAIYVENRPDRGMAAKIYPLRDSVILYVPYRITVHNDRPAPVKLTGILDNIGVKPWNHLLFNDQNIEIDALYRPEYNDLQDNYLGQKYRRTIFPFIPRTFHYFRAHTVSSTALSLDTSSFSLDRIREQLTDLSKNIDIHIDSPILDSLYDADDKKRFNLRFSKRGYENNFEISLRAKINRSEQRIVSIRDSIKGLSEAEAKDFLINYMRRSVVISSKVII